MTAAATRRGGRLSITPIPNPSPIKEEGGYLITVSTHAGTAPLAGP